MKDGKYLSAHQKEILAKSFEKFLASGLKRELFTQGLYKHLSLYFGFIAHYDIHGFYAERFASPSGRRETIEMMLGASPWMFKDENTSGNGDLNLELVEIMRTYAATLFQSADSDELTALKEKQLAVDRRITFLERRKST